jgi:soluble lytic murein transglycosylase-like protein
MPYRWSAALAVIIVFSGLGRICDAGVKPFTDMTSCFMEAGSAYNIHPDVLWAIALVESGFDSQAVNWNNDGSYDYGVMQINSRWARFTGSLIWSRLWDPCTNIRIGALILSGCIKRYGYNYDAVGCYNATSSPKRVRYARKVLKVLREAADSGSNICRADRSR